ncbi:hypothetical protein CCP3SC5AM1_260011 [Gammaproteobacteria bacterium]
MVDVQPIIRMPVLLIREHTQLGILIISILGYSYLLIQIVIINFIL